MSRIIHSFDFIPNGNGDDLVVQVDFSRIRGAKEMLHLDLVHVVMQIRRGPPRGPHGGQGSQTYQEAYTRIHGGLLEDLFGWKDG